MTDDHHSTEEDLIAQRREHLKRLRDSGNAYRNDFKRDALAAEILSQHGSSAKNDLEEKKIRVKVAGRMMSRRIMGKASFAHIQDMSGRIQIFIRKDDVGEENYSEFKKFDLGDILGAEGWVFITKTGELSVHIESLNLLTKSLRPLPEKFHGLTDLESRYRQRYLDFAHYLDHIPGALIRVGTAVSPETSYGLHDSQFDIDESILRPASQIMAGALLRYLSRHAQN